MKLTFLSACDGYPLTKTYTREADGTLSSRPYPNTFNFTSHVELVTTIDQFYDHLVAHAKAGHCLLKGHLTKNLICDRRAGLISPEQTSFICLDFDDLDLGAGEQSEVEKLDQLLAQLGVGDVDYILQYSASQGISPGLRAHVFMFLESQQAPEHLKRWLIDLNLRVPALTNQLSLTKTNMDVHWVLDITTCQNDKLLYIAPPRFNNMPDPLGGNRILLQRRKIRAANPVIPTRDVLTPARELRRDLRRAAGFEDKDYVYKVDKETGYEILTNPDQMAITGMRTARGWTYLNINGSTSWGYFHKTDKPEVIGNFRGEPYYFTKDINPEYYREALERAKQAKRDAHTPDAPDEPGTDNRELHWVINDRGDGKYYKVTYNKELGVRLDPAPTVKHMQDFCTLHNVPFPDAIPDWEVKFDPTEMRPFDSEARWINLYTPTDYRRRTMKRYTEQELRELRADENSAKIPEGYYKLIRHVCGDDDTAAYRFINWLAYIWQTGRKAKTAWVFHGNYGTGKGRLLRILSLLFGEHCVITGAEQINEQFSGNLKVAMILWIDEVTTDSWDNNKVTPKLRLWIDGDKVPIRAMRKEWDSASKNFMSIIVSANEHNPVEIRVDDRRWNVAPRQETKIKYTPLGTAEFLDDDSGWLYQEKNLQEFADMLQIYKVNVAEVIEPMENEAKNEVMNVTQSLPQDIVNALLRGDVGFFLHFAAPSSPTASMDAFEANEYRRLVGQMLEKADNCPMRTADVALIFKYLAGWNQPPGKFVKAVSKFGLRMGAARVRVGERTYAGRYFKFTPSEDDLALWRQLEPTPIELVKEKSA